MATRIIFPGNTVITVEDDYTVVCLDWDKATVRGTGKILFDYTKAAVHGGGRHHRDGTPITVNMSLPLAVERA